MNIDAIVFRIRLFQRRNVLNLEGFHMLFVQLRKLFDDLIFIPLTRFRENLNRVTDLPEKYACPVAGSRIPDVPKQTFRPQPRIQITPGELRSEGINSPLN